MERFVKELEDQGYTVECGVIEKSRRKEMCESMKKLKESHDENKIKLAKRLARYYLIFDNMGPITNVLNFLLKKISMGCIVFIFISTILLIQQREVLLVLLKLLRMMKNLNPFFRYLMFTHLYSPEEIAEIDGEELWRENERIDDLLK